MFKKCKVWSTLIVHVVLKRILFKHFCLSTISTTVFKNMWSGIGWLKRLVYGNHQYPETIEELQQQVEVAAATVRGTLGVFLSINKHVAKFCSLYC